MNETLAIILSILAGAAVGTVFFAGLWLTVHRLPSARHPALLAAFSLLVWVALAVAVFIAVARGGAWLRVAACLGGFLGTRWALVKWLGTRTARRSRA